MKSAIELLYRVIVLQYLTEINTIEVLLLINVFAKHIIFFVLLFCETDLVSVGTTSFQAFFKLLYQIHLLEIYLASVRGNLVAVETPHSFLKIDDILFKLCLIFIFRVFHGLI